MHMEEGSLQRAHEIALQLQLGRVRFEPGTGNRVIGMELWVGVPSRRSLGPPDLSHQTRGRSISDAL